MKWDETIAILHGADWHGMKLGFERMEAFLSRLGNPHRKLRYIHVAGSNGKGSACAMLSSILTKAGIRTGLYISPHIERMNERWSVNGKEISDEELRELAARMNPILSSLEQQPTEFEILTAMAFVYFAEMDCDLVVLEVGMGGRFDATNIIPVPEAAVIMKIGLEHTEILGDSIEKIAFEKGGIIKEGGNVVFCHQTLKAEEVIRNICNEKRAVLHITDPALLSDCVFSGFPNPDSPAHDNLNYDLPASAIHDQSFSIPDMRDTDFSIPDMHDSDFSIPAMHNQSFPIPDMHDPDFSIPAVHDSGFPMPVCQFFSYRERKALALPLLGPHQISNAMAVLDTIDILISKGYTIPEEAIRNGLLDTRWPGRFEVLCFKPLVILDGAHNPDGAEALAEAIRQCLPGQKLIFLCGVLADKDYPEMLRVLSPLAERFILVTPPSSRALSKEKLAEELRSLFSGPVESPETIPDGLSLALKRSRETGGKESVLCFGSLYQVAEIRRFFTSRLAP